MWIWWPWTPLWSFIRQQYKRNKNCLNPLHRTGVCVWSSSCILSKHMYLSCALPLHCVFVCRDIFTCYYLETLCATEILENTALVLSQVCLQYTACFIPVTISARTVMIIWRDSLNQNCYSCSPVAGSILFRKMRNSFQHSTGSDFRFQPTLLLVEL